MIDKRAPIPWVEAQDQPRRGVKENENGALSAELSSQTPRTPPNTTTTASRILTVICLHPGKKHATYKRPHHTTGTQFTTAFDGIILSEVTKERPGPTPRSAGQRQSAKLTLDAARRKGLPQTYRVFGRTRLLKPSRGQRPIATKNKIKTQKSERASKQSRIIRAQLCYACLHTILTSTCTHNPDTEIHPPRDSPLPHHFNTLDPQERHQLGKPTENRKEALHGTPREWTNCPPEEHNTAGQDHPNKSTERRDASQGGREKHPTPQRRPTVIKANYAHKREPPKTDGTATATQKHRIERTQCAQVSGYGTILHRNMSRHNSKHEWEGPAERKSDGRPTERS